MSHLVPVQRSSKNVIVLIVTWFFVAIAGFVLLGQEEYTSVKASTVVFRFPSSSHLHLAKDKPSLFVFLHPLCPCSRATLHQLDQIQATLGQKVSITIIFSIPSGLPSGWENGDLWKQALSMNNVQVVKDLNGDEAKLFHVKGSGHTLLYEADGKILFSGGITFSRGHEGDNSGQIAILNLVQYGHSKVHNTPVFGCPLFDSHSDRSLSKEEFNTNSNLISVG